MKKFLVALVLLGTSLLCNAEIVTVPIPGAPGLSVTVGTGANALPLRDVRNISGATNITMGDDEVRSVPLGFDFPYWNQTFNQSWMSSNGFVAFQPSLGNGCCSGVDLRNTTHSAYNYTIFGVHSDLYAHPGVGSNWYLRETNTMTYGWYNVSQCCDANGGNSFEIKINSAGAVDTRIAGALVNWNTVTSGMTGNLANGEYYQYYHGQGLNITPGSANIFSWNTAGGFTGVDQCLVNPLSSPTCAGYAAAYLSQQCTVSALYNPSCPGYAAAYYTQQCSINPLYDVNCPGYASAYLSYQCSQNSLYSTTCPGYETAYFNQQCTENPLYNSRCPGYDQAYLTQQCSINPLYSTTCSGYAAAYFSQQCRLNGLYDKTCPNYAEAYATKMLLEQQGTASTVATAGVIARNAPQPSTTTTDSSGEIKIAVVADQNVNSVITNTATSASPAQAATATVPLTAPPPAPVAAVEQKREQREEKKPDATSSSVSQTAAPQGSPQDTKPAAPTARQEIQARREAAAKAKAVEDGKNLAGNMGKLADMEAQKQVQNVVIAAMGFTPGFDAYGKVFVPDVVGYKPFDIYKGQVNVDNRRLGRGLYGPSDRLHNEIVESQYRGN